MRSGERNFQNTTQQQYSTDRPLYQDHPSVWKVDSNNKYSESCEQTTLGALTSSLCSEAVFVQSISMPNREIVFVQTTAVA